MKRHEDSAQFLRRESGSAVHTLLLVALFAMLGSSAAVAESEDMFSLDDTPPAETVTDLSGHPQSNQPCQSCHEARRLPTVDAEVLAHSAHADNACEDCHADPAQPKAVDCALCHRPVVREIRQGAHAHISDGTAQTPTCIDCHGAHDVASIGSATFRDAIPQRCATCHEERYKGYMDRFHGQAATLGMATAPRCEDCHNPHAPLPQTDPKSRVAPANLVATCGKCHEDANDNFTKFDPHPQPRNREHSALVYYVNLAMELLLLGVFGFFALHTLLWLQRSVVATLRHEFPRFESAPGDKYIQRFSVFDRWMHITVIISFTLLAMTGLPLQYASAPNAQLLASLLGGEPAMRTIHLVCAAITFGYFFVHLCAVLLRFIRTRDLKLFYGADSLVPNVQDVKDVINNFAWFFYLKPKPMLGRWTYWEKFDYWAVFWGVGMIGISGAMLAFPVFSSRVLPGQLLNVAAVIHGEEALLAVGFIFVFHFFHNHLRPENFPMDVTIFTGRLSLERFKHERAAQYEQLVAAGKLEQLIVEPPSKGLTLLSTVFGYVVVIIGLVLIVDVFVTILTNTG